MIESDGERQAPTSLENVEPSHLVRYDFAKKFLGKEDIVLDIPCGCGYGSYLLSNYSKYVYGVDIFKNAIEHAEEFFKKENISFLKGDMQKISEKFKENYFDKIISFEGIEHIQDPDLFLKEVSKIIKKEGLFIVSTPRKPHGSPYHIIEFSLDEFKDILNKYFIIEDIYGQIFTDIFNLNSRKVDFFDYKRFNFIAICRKK